MIAVAVGCLAALLVGYGAETCNFIGIYTEDADGSGLEPVVRETFALYAALAALVVTVNVLLLRRRRS